MLLVDYRDGSKDLVAPLRKRGLPVQVDDLPADIVFQGRGIGGKPLLVGIEYKKLQDLMQSVRSNRLNAQNEKMIEEGIDIRLLMIQGELEIDDQGRLLKRSGIKRWKPIPGIGHGELMKRLYVLQYCTGLTWEWFKTQDIAVRTIELLYRTLTDKDLDKHDSHVQPYEAGLLVPVGKRRRSLMTFPGVAKEWSRAAIEEFGTVRKAVAASQSRWAGLTHNDRRFGDVTAQKLQEFLDAEED